MKYIFTAAIAFVMVACQQAENKLPVEYEGPLRIVEKVETYYSETEQVKVKMIADVVHEFKNGDREFPKGIYLEFFDEQGKMESTLKANHAYYFKEEKKWRGRGKVQVRNVAKDEQLNTEELFWTPDNEKIFTDKYVIIRQQEDIIEGTGLVAKQDMSDYEILNPKADFYIDENE